MKKTITLIAVSLLLTAYCLLLLPTSSLAQPGSLDLSFGTGGKVTTDFGGGDDLGYSVAIQSDGKIVVAGESGNFFSRWLALVRYNSDGTLDSTFNSDGIVTVYSGRGESVAIQSDGKIVVTGGIHNSTDDFALSRYNSNGTMDSTLGSIGIVSIDFGNSTDEATSTAIQSDGKIVEAGRTTLNGSNYNFGLIRYNNNGNLDTAFGNGGKVTTDFGSGNDFGYSVAIQTDGKIVIAETSSNGSDKDFALVRYDSDGNLDSIFGTNGKVTTNFGSSYDDGLSVAIQSDGKIVVVGSSTDSSLRNIFAIARYNSDGSLDSTFDSDGKVTTAIGSSSIIYSVVIQSDGKIVVAGSSNNYSPNYKDLALVRYNTDGSLDNTFGSSGKVITAIGDSTDAGRSVTIQGDGKIVVAGYSWNGSDNDFAIVRYNAFCSPINFSQNITLSNGQSDTVGTHIYTTNDTSGIYKDTLFDAAANGCDSIVTTNLTVLTGIEKASSWQLAVSIYPNPFSNTTVLRITNVPELRITNLELKIYDVLGQEVFYSIINNQSSIINAQGLPSGIYFYQITDKKKQIARGKIVKE